MQSITPTVFIVDDDDAIRDSIGMLMKSAGFEYQTYGRAQEFLDNYNTARLGCLLLDIRMPGMDGLELQEKMTSMSLDLPIVFITGHGDVPIAVEAMKRGAADFFKKPFCDQELLERINQILKQSECNHQKLADSQLALERLETLTTREREIMAMVVEGSGNKKIAAELGISQRTVELHRAHVMEKMQVSSLAQLVKACFMLKECKQCASPLSPIN